jgi:hypothetical protein
MGIEVLAQAYSSILSSIPLWAQKAINLLFLIMLVVIYAVFIWKLHRFVAKKNILELNLNKYNTSEHPILSKFFGFLLYSLEYLIIFPILIFFWFCVFGVFLILMTQNIEVSNIIILTATIVGAIRVISYLPKFGEALAKEIAKLLPLTLLAIAMITPNFFDFSRIIQNLSEIPEFVGEIAAYLVFILALETILRLIDSIASAWRPEKS